MLFRNFRKQSHSFDDGYPIRDVARWSLEKHRIFKDYLGFFFGDKKLPECREISFVAPNAGSGLCRSGAHVFRDLPLIALDKRYPFTKYIFSAFETQAAALKIRVNKTFRSRNTVILNRTEDMDDLDRIRLYLPDPATTHKTKNLCLLDINTLELGFDFIKALSQLKIELVLFFVLHLKDQKAYQEILDEQPDVLGHFTGEPVGDTFGNVSNNELFFRTLVNRYLSLLSDLGYNIQGGYYPCDVSDTGLSFFYSGYFSMQHSVKKMKRFLGGERRTQYQLFH